MIVIALLLAALGGFVDAIASLGLGGFFGSFMSGNTTRMGIGPTTGNIMSKDKSRPLFSSDEQAEDFVSSAELTGYDLSALTRTRF